LEVAEGLKQENKAEVTRSFFHFSSRGPYLADSEGRTDKRNQHTKEKGEVVVMERKLEQIQCNKETKIKNKINKNTLIVYYQQMHLMLISFNLKCLKQ
jgi:hypothetical protein